LTYFGNRFGLGWEIDNVIGLKISLPIATWHISISNNWHSLWFSFSQTKDDLAHHIFISSLFYFIISVFGYQLKNVTKGLTSYSLLTTWIWRNTNQNIKVINNQYKGNWTHRFPLEQLKVKRWTCSTILCWRMVDLAITLMATLSPVSEFLANLTLANVPSPIVRPTSYFPIFLLTVMVFRRSFIAIAAPRGFRFRDDDLETELAPNEFQRKERRSVIGEQQCYSGTWSSLIRRWSRKEKIAKSWNEKSWNILEL